MSALRGTLLFVVVLSTTVVVAQETSVRPGINDSFQNPDVDQFVERFETESREVFARRAEIVQACGLQTGQTVADIGAGTGLFTQQFAKQVGPDGMVIAVDIAQNFLDHIRQQAQANGLKNIATRKCAADDVRLQPESIDVAFICDTYHHFEFPLKTMASLRNALKPGGRVVIIDFKKIPGQSSDFVMGHVRAGQDVFESEIVQSGFQKLKQTDGLLDENYFVEFVKSSTPGLTAGKTPIITGFGSVAEVPEAALKAQPGRSVVFDVTAATDGDQPNKGLDRAARLLNLYGNAGLTAKDVHVTVVLHGNATASALSDAAFAATHGTSGNPNGPLIQELRAAGVEVFVCGQALNYKGYPRSMLAEGIAVADAALTVLIERQAAGAAYLPVP
ncbi:MAG: methyltransferase domain-containing protein [Planctomycetaceae bacterium]